MNDDDEVGYRKPPKQHRFKPGNQLARRRKGQAKPATFTMAGILTTAMSTRRKIRRGDQLITMNVAEILIERIIQMATTGSARDATILMTLIERHAPQLLAAPLQETRVTYHRAAGSTVELPSQELWKGEDQ